MATSAVQAASSAIGIKIRLGEDRRAKVTLITKDPLKSVADVSVKEASKILKEWVGTGSVDAVGIVADEMVMLNVYLPLLTAISENSSLRLYFIDGVPDHNDFVAENIRKKIEQVGSGQPATRSESKPEGAEKPQPEAEGRSR